MEISLLCGRTLFSKDVTLWHITEEFVIDSVLKCYSASFLPYSKEKHKDFPSSRSSQLIALPVSCNHSLRVLRVFCWVFFCLQEQISQGCLIYFTPHAQSSCCSFQINLSSWWKCAQPPEVCSFKSNHLPQRVWCKRGELLVHSERSLLFRMLRKVALNALSVHQNCY